MGGTRADSTRLLLAAHFTLNATSMRLPLSPIKPKKAEGVRYFQPYLLSAPTANHPGF
jgi:hypothetical protein